MKKIIMFIFTIMLVQLDLSAQNSQLLFSASADRAPDKCIIRQGDVSFPQWYKNGSGGNTKSGLWRIGRQLVIVFNSPKDIQKINYIRLKVWHTGSWGINEYTLGKVVVNGNPIADNYVAPDHMNENAFDTFAIPVQFMKQKSGEENILVFSLGSSSTFVWWIRKIEAVYEPSI